ILWIRDPHHADHVREADRVLPRVRTERGAVARRERSREPLVHIRRLSIRLDIETHAECLISVSLQRSGKCLASLDPPSQVAPNLAEWRLPTDEAYFRAVTPPTNWQEVHTCDGDRLLDEGIDVGGE